MADINNPHALLPYRRWMNDLFDIHRALATRSGAAVKVEFDPELGAMFWGTIAGQPGYFWWRTSDGTEVKNRTEFDLVPAPDPLPSDSRDAVYH